PLGRKIALIAIRSEDSAGITSSLPIRSPRPGNWEEGIEAAYEGRSHLHHTPSEGLDLCSRPGRDGNGRSTVRSINRSEHCCAKFPLWSSPLICKPSCHRIP